MRLLSVKQVTEFLLATSTDDLNDQEITEAIDDFVEHMVAGGFEVESYDTDQVVSLTTLESAILDGYIADYAVGLSMTDGPFLARKLGASTTEIREAAKGLATKLHELAAVAL